MPLAPRTSSSAVSNLVALIHCAIPAAPIESTTVGQGINGICQKTLSPYSPHHQALELETQAWRPEAEVELPPPNPPDAARHFAKPQSSSRLHSKSTRFPRL